MPETACLHIQARDSDPIRVVELPGSSVRIGRASYCEVRLSEPELADEECRLKRRGGIWQLVPSRAAGFISIEGRSVQATCAVPFDVPFRVGDHWLTLRPTGSATPDWREYRLPEPSASALASAPVPEESRPPVPVPRAREESSDLFDFSPAPPRATPPAPPQSQPPQYDPLSRLKGQQEARPASRSTLTPEERRWENRWRAAGERVRARPAVKATPISTPPPATAPPSASAPLIARSPLPSQPLDTPIPRHAAFDTTKLRDRIRQGIPPVDRRVPPVVPPSIPTLKATQAETSSESTTPFLASELIRPVISPVENRLGTVPSTELEPETLAPSTSDGSSLEAPRVAPASVAEVASEAEAPVEALDEIRETLPAPDAIAHDNASAVEGSALADLASEPPTRGASVVEDSVVEDNSESVGIADDTDPNSITLVENEPSEIAAEAARETSDAAVWDALPVNEPAAEVAAPLESVVAINQEPPESAVAIKQELSPTLELEPEDVARFRAEAEALHQAEVESTPTVEVEVEAKVEPAATSEVEVQPPQDIEVGAEVSSAPLTAPRSEPTEQSESGFVTDAGLADPAEVKVEKSDFDLTTSVHDAYGHTSDEAAPAPPPRPTGTGFTAQTDAKAARSPLPELGWASPHGSTARSKPEAPKGETVPPLSNRDWPSARDILASHRASVQRATAPRPTAQTPLKAAVLTELQEPAHWSFPLWLGWPPTFLFVVVAGLLGLYLSWIWSIDTRWSGTVAGVLARSGANVKPLSDTIPTPSGSWWKSNSANLMLWSTYFDRRAASEPELAERANALLEAASQASPIQAQTRFAMARRTNPRDETPGAALSASLGLSQDVEAQAWLGRQLLQSGKKEAALKAYRRALEMASRAEVVRHTPPTFDDDAQVLRYHLPGEDLAKRVVRDMAEQTNWTFSDWKEALPSFALIPLSVARLFRQQGSSDADVALDLILDRLDEPAPAGCSKVLHLAAQAEALAFKGRWKDAESRYREAIEQMPIDLINRSWWLNLAEVDRRLNDESGRQTALGMAKGMDANDEIAQRAVDQLKFSGTRADRARAQR